MDTTDAKNIPSSASYLHHLAVELIVSIMELALPPATIISPSRLRKRQRDAMTLSQIDSRIRTIALHSAPAMWTSIHIDHKRGSWQLAKRFYGRSGELGLQVHLNMLHARRRNSVPLEVCRPLSGVGPRLTVLLVNSSPRMRGQLAVMLGRIAAPMLRELTLLYEGRGETREWEWNVPRLPGAENVKTVTLAGVRVDCLKDPLPFVTQLKLVGRPGTQVAPLSMEFVRDIARNIPNLESLALRGMCHLSHNFIDIRDPLVLPSLRHMEITRVTHLFVASLLMILAADNLESIHLDSDGTPARVNWTRYIHWETITTSYPKVKVAQVEGAISILSDDLSRPRNRHVGMAHALARMFPNITQLKCQGYEFVQAIGVALYSSEGTPHLPELSRLEIKSSVDCERPRIGRIAMTPKLTQRRTVQA